ncbi:MAG: EamA family transporter [Candidatus Moraniibacteriota bacterium]|nr:MAG: EamA family transporter [Candidatus Moranbacteria bacterium]
MESWLFIALVAPLLWAIVNLIDVYFVDSIYSDEYDGAIVSGAFQLLPWLTVLVGAWRFSLPNAGVLSLALSGALFVWANFFYFKALFAKNDASLVQLLWNFTVPMTMLLSWVMYRDVLHANQYIGCLLVFLGVSALHLSKSFSLNQLTPLLAPMGSAVVFLSVSMLLASHGYSLSDGIFFDGYLLFSSGAIAGTLFLVAFRRLRHGSGNLARIFTLSRSYFLVFFSAEALALVGTMFSQRALDLSPSSALVATIESLSPIIVMLFSVFIVLSSEFSSSLKARVAMYGQQLVGYKIKIFCSIIISTGVFFLST